MRKQIALGAIAGLFLVTATVAAAFVVSTFPESVYNPHMAVMDAVLGIDEGFAVEGFEDNYFTGGFSLFYQRSNAPTAHEFRDSNAAEAWDGDRVLYIVGGKRESDNGGALISFDRPVTAVGIGLSNMQDPNWFIDINGDRLIDDVSSLPRLTLSSKRNGYLVISAEHGEQIHSILIDRTGFGDRLSLDHLAFKVTAATEKSVNRSIK